MRSFRASWLALASLTLALASGCASTEELATWWPWYEPDQSALLAKYGPISRQKIERFEELRKANRSTPLGPQAEQELAAQLRTESDPWVRLHIVRLLGECQSTIAQATVAMALKDPDVDVRVEACRSLGRQGGPESSRLLGEALASDTSVDVRIAATQALGEMRDPQAVPLLTVALEDPDPALQFRGVEAMRLATGKDLGNDVNRWREYAQNPDPNAPEESVAGKLRRMF